jgi:hypothetical protein
MMSSERRSTMPETRDVTAEEKLLAFMATRRGQKWAADNAELIIEQARMLGELQEERW